MESERPLSKHHLKVVKMTAETIPYFLATVGTQKENINRNPKSQRNANTGT